MTDEEKRARAERARAAFRNGELSPLPGSPTLSMRIKDGKITQAVETYPDGRAVDITSEMSGEIN